MTFCFHPHLFPPDIYSLNTQMNEHMDTHRLGPASPSMPLWFRKWRLMSFSSLCVSSSMTLSSRSWFFSNSAPFLVLPDNWNRQTNPFTVMLVISQSTTQSWTISSLVPDANPDLPPPHPSAFLPLLVFFFILLFWPCLQRVSRCSVTMSQSMTSHSSPQIFWISLVLVSYMKL